MSMMITAATLAITQEQLITLPGMANRSRGLLMPSVATGVWESCCNLGPQASRWGLHRQWLGSDGSASHFCQQHNPTCHLLLYIQQRKATTPNTTGLLHMVALHPLL
jgi:hypothetical protein